MGFVITTPHSHRDVTQQCIDFIYLLAERFEEDNDPEAAFSEEDDFNSPSVTDHPRSDFSEGSKNINLNL